MPKKILLLSASAGAGHMRAADALRKVFETHTDVSHVEHWDMLKYTNRVFEHLYGKMYLDLVNKAPAMLGWFYDLSDTPYKNDKLRVIFEKLNSTRFIRAVKKYSPDLVVCTHFTPAAILSWLGERGEISLAPAITVTDFDCHAMWLVRNYARYFVALPETKAYLTCMGIDASKIEVTGIPIDPIFEIPKDKQETRRSLGLAETTFTILVSAGGFGVGPVEKLLQELLRLTQPLQIVAIAGQSEELKAKLDIIATSATQEPVTLHPVGFTQKMDDYMAAADILVGKAGGLTSSEAMARGLPLCIVNPIPGQEERNSDHLLEAGAAIRCNNLEVLSWKLAQLIPDRDRMRMLQEQALKFGRPFAARQIVDCLMKMEK